MECDCEGENVLSPPPYFTTFQKWLQYFAIFLAVVAGALYLYHFHESFKFSLTFPSGTKLEISMWIMHISFRFLALWIPCIFILCRFYPESIIALIIYNLGCVIAVVFSITATILISKYQNKGSVYADYENAVKSGIEKNQFLDAIVNVAESEDCCGWTGSIEFGTIFDISRMIPTEYEFMKKLEKCSGNSWSVKKVGGKNVYSEGHAPFKIRQGCGPYFKRLYKRNCNLIFYLGLLTDLVGVTMIILSIIHYIKFKDGNVPPPEPAPSPSVSVLPIPENGPESESEVPEVSSPQTSN